MSVVSVKLNGVLCIIPTHDEKVRQAVLQSGIHVNGFRNEGGWEPGFGHLLLLRRDLTALLPLRDLTLTIKETESSTTNTVTIVGLHISETQAFAPTSGLDDLIIVKIEDERAFGMHNQRYIIERDSDLEPRMHKAFPKMNNLADGNMQNVLKFLWTKSNMPGVLNFGYAAGNVFNNLFDIRDIFLHNEFMSWNLFKKLWSDTGGSLYKDTSFYRVIPHARVDQTNTTLVDANVNKLVSKRDDLSEPMSFLPEKINVYFRRRRSVYYGPFVRSKIYSGSETVVPNLERDVFLPNFWDAINKSSASLTQDRDLLNSIGDGIANRFFDAYANHNKFNAIYFGVIPFIPSPECHVIEYWHDVVDNKYKTLIKSVDVLAYQSTPWGHNHYINDDQMYWVQAPSGGVPAGTTATPGEEDCYVCFEAEEDGIGYVVGDLLKLPTSRFNAIINVKNFFFDIAADYGDHRIEVSGHFDGCKVKGWSQTNTGASSDIKEAP